MEIALQRALLWIVLLPLLASALIGLLGRRASRATISTVAVGSVAGAFVLALAAFSYLLVQRTAGNEGAQLSVTTYRWFSLTVRGAVVPIDIRLVMDALSGVMTLVVTGVGLLIHVYACGYMATDPGYARFFSYMNLFTASMLILVLASNLPVMFVGWEGVGLCSYLLIGFWFETPAFAAAGRKAFVANRIGDFGALVGMFLLVRATGSFEFETVNRALTALTGQYVLTFGAIGITVATAATLLLFLGCTGKSAQIPLFVWLPDAMAGPTPVSALIHAATMVTSGVYLVCRLSPVFSVAPYSMAVVATVGTLTAVVAASTALVQVDIKRILAYSTISQLGFMFAAVGCGAFAAGFFHVFTHAFFKACLFLGAGSVMRAVGAHGDADIRTLGGLAKYQPRTHWTFLISCLAIAGVPLFSGFFSKDEILAGALGVGSYFWFAPWLGTALFVLLAAAAAMTAFYMFRLYFTVFWGEYRGGPEAVHRVAASAPRPRGSFDASDFPTPHESPRSMTWPLILHAIGAVFSGYLWVGIAHFEPWVKWLEPSLGQIGIEISRAVASKATMSGVIAAALGVGVAWAWYGKPGIETAGRLADQLPDVYEFLRNGWRFDRFYEATALRASRSLAVGSAQFDQTIVDGLMADAPSFFTKRLNYYFTRIQNGSLHTYGAVMAVGLVLVGYWYLTPHAQLYVLTAQPPATRYEVRLAAITGLGYRYRWDFNSDGRYDTDWRDQSTISHRYHKEELDPGPVVRLKPVGYDVTPISMILNLGETLKLHPDQLGRWTRHDFAIRQRFPELVNVLPRIIVEQTSVVIRPNGANVRKRSRVANPTEEVRVGLGESVKIGEAELSVAGRARTTVQVKNAFGIRAQSSLFVTVNETTMRLTSRAVSGGAP